jgi:hypothetical protein
LLIGVAFAAILPGRERRERATSGSCVAATGFTLMALQIFLLLGFQAVYGYVYTELAILIGLFMAGIALGSWLGMRREIKKERFEEESVSGHEIADRGKDHLGGNFVNGHDFSRAVNLKNLNGALAPAGKLGLATIQLLLALAAPALLLTVSAVGNLSSLAATWLAAEIAFPALAALAGILGGFQFVTAAGIFLRNRGQGAGLGLLYAIDLLGGCVGALLLAAYLIPVFGLWRTACLCAAVNAVAALLAARVGREGKQLPA